MMILINENLLNPEEIRHKNISDPESVRVINKFKLLFIHENEQCIEHNSSTSNDPVDFSITNSKRSEHNIKQNEDHF